MQFKIAKTVDADSLEPWVIIRGSGVTIRFPVISECMEAIKRGYPLLPQSVKGLEDSESNLLYLIESNEWNEIVNSFFIGELAAEEYFEACLALDSEDNKWVIFVDVEKIA